jgi:hypothetical protein
MSTNALPTLTHAAAKQTVPIMTVVSPVLVMLDMLEMVLKRPKAELDAMILMNAVMAAMIAIPMLLAPIKFHCLAVLVMLVSLVTAKHVPMSTNVQMMPTTIAML